MDLPPPAHTYRSSTLRSSLGIRLKNQKAPNDAEKQTAPQLVQPVAIHPLGRGTPYRPHFLSLALKPARCGEFSSPNPPAPKLAGLAGRTLMFTGIRGSRRY